MPVMDGYELVRPLRLDPTTSGIPVVFYTAHYSESEARALALSSGVSDVLTKPAEFEEVPRIVDRALSGESQAGMPPDTSPLTTAFDGEHLRLLTDKLHARSLIESNIDALMTTDPRGMITDVNKQTEALTGCTRDELIGAPFKNYFTDAGRAEAGINRVLAEGKITDYELTALARDGTLTVVSYNATTFHDRDRRLQGVFAAARDVTELKRFAHALQQKNAELEAPIA